MASAAPEPVPESSPEPSLEPAKQEPASEPAPPPPAREVLPAPASSANRQNALIMAGAIGVIAAGLAATWYLLRPAASPEAPPPAAVAPAPAPVPAAKSASRQEATPARPAAKSAPPPRADSGGFAGTGRVPPPPPPPRHDEWSGDDPPAMPSIQVAKPGNARPTLDESYQRRVLAECDPGFTGFACREKVRFEVCKNRWNDGGDPRASVCATANSNRF